MKLDFELDLEALAACQYSMSNEETRYYICGVHIRKRGDEVIYESTNGHIAVQVLSSVEVDGEIDIIIPSYIVKLISKKQTQKNFGVDGITRIPCSVDETRINIEMTNGVINFKLIDGTFPDIDKVIPTKSDITFNEIALDGTYIDALAKSNKSFTGSTLLSLEFTGDEYGGPILVKNSTSQCWLAVIMPCRF